MNQDTDIQLSGPFKALDGSGRTVDIKSIRIFDEGYGVIDLYVDLAAPATDGLHKDQKLIAAISAHLRALGYDVAYNHPYKGVELVRRYGKPAQQRHSVQLEINRKLYMDEQTLALHAGADGLKAHLRSLVELLLATDPRQL